jgi:tetratricopeptide (TPR) repeat protein
MKKNLLCVLSLFVFINTGCDKGAQEIKPDATDMRKAELQQPSEGSSLQKMNEQASKKYKSVSNPLNRMEYPEYRTFISRDEQIVLLDDSILKYKLEVDASDSRSLNNAGYNLYEKKDYIGAVRFFREAVYVDPANVYAHYNLACCLSLTNPSIDSGYVLSSVGGSALMIQYDYTMVIKGD